MTNDQMQTAREKIRPLVDKAAEALVMGDLSDDSWLRDLTGVFLDISGILDNNFPRACRAAEAAGRLLENAGKNSRDLDGDDFQDLEQVVSQLQAISEKSKQDADLVFPQSFAPPPFSENDSGAQAGQNGCAGGLASAVDQEILDEYLAQQETVISEIEEKVLNFEQSPDLQVLKELKRLLHTAKGEAGVMGLNTIERACHRVEDYIQQQEDNLQADLLLEFKDWFEQTIAALKQDTDQPCPDSLFNALEEAINAASDATSTGFEAKETVSPADEPASAPQQAFDPPCEQKPLPDQEADETDGEIAAIMAPVAIEDPEITADFISEANEHFDISDENLLTLENDPENEEAVASIFRAFHTIKGTTSFLGLTPVSVLAHKAENLLDEVRKKRISFDGLVVDATFNALDLLKKMNKDLESALAAGEMFVPPEELADVFVQLKAALGDQGSWDIPGAVKTGSGQPDAQTCLETAQEKAMAVDASFSDASRASDSQVLDAGSDLPSQPGSGALPEMSSDPAAANGGATHAGKTVRQTMKIDADRIDLLLETIGELVIVESIVSQEVAERQSQARDLERNLGQLKKITRSLQDIGMSMRLIPIDNTFRKMGRLVRDLSKKSGKKIELVMEGRETELDKGMVEKLGDPLVHMIRNAVDHGIEPTADERIAAGKPATGTIVLKAYHQGGNIHIDITDDGRGLDRGAILAKAVERGLVTGEDNMSDEDIYSLIFEPGFSTAKQITDVSGRGVGMDVVKSNIESMRGNVRIKSQKGFGSTFTLVLPLTMAIIDGMIVRVGSERYILPLLSIIESFQPTKKMITTVSGKGETVPFRNRLLPLFRLSSVFNVSDAQSDPTKALVVVLEDAGRQIALLVDELLGQNQTVIKNLGQGLKHIDGIAGASIMPDGTPGLIVDVNGLVKLATA